MQIKFLVLAVLAAMPGLSSAEKGAWRIEAAQSTDAEVDISNGHFWALPGDVSALGVNMTKVTTENGLIDLSTVGKVTVNEQTSTLSIDTFPGLLQKTHIDILNQSMFMSPAKPAGSFVNYDLRADSSQHVSTFAGLFEANTFVKNDIRLNAQELLKTGQAPQRLSANLSHEDVETTSTWLVGDSYSVAGTGVAPVRFTGLQYKKDYSLTPGFITSPTYNVSGTAAALSTLDVMINNQVVRSQQIQPGPFDITNIQPLVGTTGARIVVTDAFGQQQIISQQVIGNPVLLKAGLEDYSIQAGAIRPTLERTESPFVSGFYRKGIDQTLTVELNSEYSAAGSTLPAVHHAGANAAFATPYGNLSLGGRTGSGSSVNAVYQNAWYSNTWNKSFSASITKNSDNYLQMGGGLISPLITSIQGSVQKNRLSINAQHSLSFGQHFSSVGVVLSPETVPGITWMASFTKITGSTTNSNLMLSASIPLDGHAVFSGSTHTATASVSSRGESGDYFSTPLSGYGASFHTRLESINSIRRVETEANYTDFQFDTGFAASNIKQEQTSQTGLRGFVRGGLVIDGNNVLPTRYISSGFAVVDAGTPDATVDVNNVPNAKTNKDGMAAISGFPPFMSTAVSLSSDALPDNYDDVTLKISTFRKAGTKISFRGHSMAMVRVPGYKEGVLNVNGQDFPITNRGAFVELPEGFYSGSVDGHKVVFSIPKSTQLASVEAEFLPVIKIW